MFYVQCSISVVLKKIPWKWKFDIWFAEFYEFESWSDSEGSVHHNQCFVFHFFILMSHWLSMIAVNSLIHLLHYLKVHDGKIHWRIRAIIRKRSTSLPSTLQESCDYPELTGLQSFCMLVEPNLPEDFTVCIILFLWKWWAKFQTSSPI